MTFLWPVLLPAILVVPLGLLLCLSIARARRRRLTAAGLGGWAALSTGRGGSGAVSVAPRLLLVSGFAILLVGLARPQADVPVAAARATVVLAVDVSASMVADDLKPTRMAAALASMRTLIAARPDGVEIAIVAFSDNGLTIQAPTTDAAALAAAIARLQPRERTSLSDGIDAAMDALSRSGSNGGSGAIVLLTDGEDSGSADPLAAADRAARARVPISSIGIGSVGGATVMVNGFRVRTHLDAGVLQQIAARTGGIYVTAGDTAGLTSLYDHIATHLTVKTETTELTGLFAGTALVLMTLGALASLAWSGRLG